GAWRIALVKLGDSLSRGLQQVGIGGVGGLRRVGEIRKKTVENIRVPVGEKTNFQFLELCPNHFVTAEHHRHHDESRVLWWNAVTKIELGQRVGGQERNYECIHDLNAKLAEGEDCKRRQRDQNGGRMNAFLRGQQPCEGGEARGQPDNTADVYPCAVAADEPEQPRARWDAGLRITFKIREAV